MGLTHQTPYKHDQGFAESATLGQRVEKNTGSLFSHGICAGIHAMGEWGAAWGFGTLTSGPIRLVSGAVMHFELERVHAEARPV